MAVAPCWSPGHLCLQWLFSPIPREHTVPPTIFLRLGSIPYTGTQAGQSPSSSGETTLDSLSRAETVDYA